LMPIPDPDLAADMYEYAEEFLASNGYAHYEISNWAKSVERSTLNVQRSYECRHNLQYWRSLPYLAFGAGAHGYANGYRYSNILRIKTYIERVTGYRVQVEGFDPSRSLRAGFPLSPAVVNQHKQTIQDDISDYMINNLRLTNIGVVDSDFKSRFGRGLLDVYPKEVEELIRNGLLEYAKTSEVLETSEVCLRLTQRGRLLGNQVFVRFV